MCMSIKINISREKKQNLFHLQVKVPVLKSQGLMQKCSLFNCCHRRWTCADGSWVVLFATQVFIILTG